MLVANPTAKSPSTITHTQTFPKRWQPQRHLMSIDLQVLRVARDDSQNWLKRTSMGNHSFWRVKPMVSCRCSLRPILGMTKQWLQSGHRSLGQAPCPPPLEAPPARHVRLRKCWTPRWWQTCKRTEQLCSLETPCSLEILILTMSDHLTETISANHFQSTC